MKNLILIFLLLPGIIFGQYNEKEILKKQAASYVSRRQYERANSLYEQILKDNPNDVGVVELYITNLMRVSKFDRAEEKLAAYKNILPEITQIRLRIPILIVRGEIAKARKTAFDFLEKNRGNISFHQMLAVIFTQYRQDEIAIAIYQKARNFANDKFLFARELAQNYQNSSQYEQAVEEYFTLLQNQSAYSNYILSRLKTILQEDDSQIRSIEKQSEKYPNEKSIEIYALCLADLQMYQQALQQYEKLNAEKLASFARRMKLVGNLEIAETAYSTYLQKTADIVRKANAQMELAEVLLQLQKFYEAEEILLQVYNNKELQDRRYRYRTKANRQCRELLAELVLRQQGREEEVISYLEEAKQHAFNQIEISEIEFKIINLLMLIEKFDESQRKLTELLRNEDTGTEIFKKGYLYSYWLAVFRKDTAADSLLGEIIINLPEDDAANDALLLANLLPELDDKTAENFLTAFRRKLIFRNEEAISILQNIYRESENEEMLFLAGEWARAAGDHELAKNIFSRDFDSEVISEYAILNLAELSNEKKIKNDFLLEKPTSVFSAHFRLINAQ